MKHTFLIIPFSICSAHGAVTTVVSTTLKAGASYLAFDVSQFDSSLGTLTGVTVSVTAQLTGSATITNTSLATEQINGFDSTLTAKTTNSDLGYTQRSITISDVVTSPDWAATDLAPSAAQTFTFATGQSFNIASATIDPSKFANYIGAGNVTFQAKSVNSVGFTGELYNYNGSNSGADTQFSIQYTYTPSVSPVPETSSLAAVACLISGGLLTRRRVLKRFV